MTVGKVDANVGDICLFDKLSNDIIVVNADNVNFISILCSNWYSCHSKLE